MDIAGNLSRIEKRIASACAAAGRDRAAVRLIAVTKSQPPEVLPALRRLGVRDFGENRVEHLQKMAAAAEAGDRFHFLGRLQSRQLKQIQPHIACLHSLTEPNHAEKLAALAGATGRPLPVYLQVNAAGEAQKAGVDLADCAACVQAIRQLPQLQLIGLMCMAPDPDLPGVEPQAIAECFARTAAAAAAAGLQRLSMGMSKDFELAIAAGATDLRIGTELFA